MKKNIVSHELSLILIAAFYFLATILLFSCRAEKKEVQELNQQKVRLGVEVFLEKNLGLVRGKKVGLITNPTGVDSHLRSIIELFSQNPEIDLVALYGPEHGVRGDAQAGEYVPFYIDKKWKLPVFSLYGQSLKPVPGMLKDIDEYMRSFDTEGTGKIPESSMVKGIDVLIFDIQDVGTRIYTYISTMAYAMQACAEKGIDFIVLDRPNPINGMAIEGPILEYPDYSSFVGLYPVPVRHGMTAGELACLFNDKFLEKKANLKVVPLQGWKRSMWYDNTSLPWVAPSPNIPTLTTATVYPGQVYLEGTNVSEGRGTTKPFEFFGAPWIDGNELTERLNALDLPGVKFREAWFTPTFSKFEGELCGGSQIHVLNRDEYRALESSFYIIKTISEMYPDKFEFHQDYFDKIMGTSKVREAFEKGIAIKDIMASFKEGLARFSELRKNYLLY